MRTFSAPLLHLTLQKMPHARTGAVLLWLVISLGFLLIPGCRANPAPAALETNAAETETTEESTALQGEAESTTLPPESFQATVPPQDNAGEAPLRFTFPTPVPAPVSLWRPPLYDTPWALGPNDHFFFARPIAADEVNWPNADYRYGGIFFSEDTVHTGIDIPTPTGTPIIAAGNGRVVWAGYGLYYGNNDPDDPYGLAVTVCHDFGFEGQRVYTVYGHMDRIDVVTGQEVKMGDQLGIVGTTGFTTGPHLHFEVRLERNSYFATFNPELWLAPPQGWGVLVGTLKNTNGSFLTQHDVEVRNKETRQKWVVRSYGNQAVNSDPYWGENLVLSDLPTGEYEISIDYEEETYKQDVTILPGAISYFRFRGKLLFDQTMPPSPSVEDLISGPVEP